MIASDVEGVVQLKTVSGGVKVPLKTMSGDVELCDKP